MNDKLIMERKVGENGILHYISTSDDGLESISEELAILVSKKKARLVRITVYLGELGCEQNLKTAFGQGGLFHDESHGLIFVSARHNFMFSPRKDEEAEPSISSNICHVEFPSSSCYQVIVTGFRKHEDDLLAEAKESGSPWKFGRDISVGKLTHFSFHYTHEMKKDCYRQMKSMCFDTLPADSSVDYQTLVGARIGIAVYMHESYMKTIKEMKEGAKACFEKTNRTQIFDGKLLAVNGDSTR